MRRTRIIFLGRALAAATPGASTSGVAAGRGGMLRIEPGWYEGHGVSFLQPSLFSASPNGGVLACFGLGPDLAGIVRPTQPLYVLASGSLIDVTAALASGGPVRMIAPVIGGG